MRQLLECSDGNRSFDGGALGWTRRSDQIQNGDCITRAPEPGGSVSGSVLIIVLWIALGLVSVTLVFGRSMFFEFKASDNSFAGAQAEQAIEGALRYAVYVLSNLEEEGRFPDPESVYRAEQVSVGEATFWLLGRSEEDERGLLPQYGLIDEAAKLNLNTATVAMLEKLPNMPVELAAAIVDWRDEDEDVTTNGAESETYRLRDPAYQCKNAPFETVEELNLVYGATPEILYGEDANMNGMLDTNENDGDATPPSDNQDGVLDLGILEYVTVYSQEPAGEESEGGEESEEPVRRVNINTARKEVLACIPGFDETIADQIVAYRIANPDSLSAEDWYSEVVESGVLSEAEDYITTQTYQYTADIAAVGRNGRGYRRVKFVIDLQDGTPRVRYRKDLSRLGWALGLDVRNRLLETER